MARATNYTKWTDEKVSEIKSLIVEGYTIQQIADKFKVKNGSIKGIMIRFNFSVSDLTGKNFQVRTWRPPVHRRYTLCENKIYEVYRRGKGKKQMKYLGRTGAENLLLMFEDITTGFIECYSRFSRETELQIKEVAELC